jgi:septal ring factor EnvC (AmiA/AmiB activator)
LQQAHFATQTRELGQLLTVLQRMGSNPPPAMITHRKDALAMVRSAMMLSTVFPEHRDKALLLKRELDKLDRVLAEETKQRDLVKSEHERLAAEQARLDPLIEAKRLAITETEQELAGLRTLAKTQAKSVLDIRDLIKTLDKAVADKTALGAYETELAEAVLAGHEPEPPAAVPTSPDAGEALAGDAAPDIQAGSTPERPLAADVAFLDPGRIKPAVPFDKAKGLLPSPVRGDMILSFGQKTRSGSKSKGIAYATRAQAQITSPCDGWVVYAGEFRSYGQVLIINAGGGYHLLLAGMAQINVQVGQFVLSSEPVGKMGAARQSADGAGEPAPPILYLELRSKERPINPDPWWGPSGQKVANG